MRTLEFITHGQKLLKNDTCDFSNIIPNSEHYLKIRIYFDNTWNGMIKAAVFKERDIEIPVLLTHCECEIPSEVLTRRSFSVRIEGKKDDTLVRTNTIIIKQEV